VRRLQHLPLGIGFDLVVTVALVLLTQRELHSSWDDGFRAGPVTPWGAVLVASMVLPFALRTLRPAWAWAGMLAVYGCASVWSLQPLLFWGYVVPLGVLTYAVARHVEGIVGRLALLTAPGLIGVISVHTTRYDDVNDIGFLVVWFAVPWAIGRVLHHLARQRDELAHAWHELAEAESLRRGAAVEHERRRIAVEIHDVVAHAVGLTVLQVGAARLELETRGAPDPLVQELRDAEGSGREALDQVRRALGVLRLDADPSSGLVR
jgi:signal transduction histidine kinase